MIPSAFVILDKLPLTLSGKVDYRALPAPDKSRGDQEVNYVAPRNHVEEVVVQILEEVLGIESIGVNDDFFLLGGHSLLAIRAISRLRDVFQIELSLATLFTGKTAAKLAEALIANEPKPGRVEKIAKIIKRIEEMSDADAHATLNDRRLERVKV
jgi:acyl carrier protein